MSQKQSPNKTQLQQVIAVVGCDGSGKSTLTSDLVKELSKKQPVELIYLGQSSGAIADWIKGLPVVGPKIEKFLKSKAKNVHGKKNAPKGILTIMVIYLLSRWRKHKFKRMLKLDKKNILIVTDRYPQSEVPGFYFDGTGLKKLTITSWLGKKLQKREQCSYQWMASFLPALLIRLNIDAETAHQRKPDHKLDMLKEKIEVIPNLDFNQANILELDGTDPYEKVLSTALKEIDRVL